MPSDRNCPPERSASHRFSHRKYHRTVSTPAPRRQTLCQAPTTRIVLPRLDRHMLPTWLYYRPLLGCCLVVLTPVARARACNATSSSIRCFRTSTTPTARPSCCVPRSASSTGVRDRLRVLRRERRPLADVGLTPPTPCWAEAVRRRRPRTRATCQHDHPPPTGALARPAARIRLPLLFESRYRLTLRPSRSFTRV